MKTITIPLTDDMTMGSLRRLAVAIGKTVKISFDSGPRRPAKRQKALRKRRKLSAALRATLVANAAKARAALARKRAAATA